MTTTELPTPTATWIDHETELAELVAGARAGCAASWREIVNRYDDRLQRAARALGLDESTAADAVQQTWLAVVTNIKALRAAEALGGWLRSILHRECLKALNLRHREIPRDNEGDLAGHTKGRTIVMRTEPRSPEEETLQREQGMLVHAAQHRLSRRDQDLLALLVVDPPLPYTEISRRLGVPIGSIGPTRARCLARLRRELAALGVNASGDAPRVPRQGRRPALRPSQHTAERASQREAAPSRFLTALGSPHAGWARSRAGAAPDRVG